MSGLKRRRRVGEFTRPACCRGHYPAPLQRAPNDCGATPCKPAARPGCCPTRALSAHGDVATLGCTPLEATVRRPRYAPADERPRLQNHCGDNIREACERRQRERQIRDVRARGAAHRRAQLRSARKRRSPGDVCTRPRVGRHSRTFSLNTFLMSAAARRPDTPAPTTTTSVNVSRGWAILRSPRKVARVRARETRRVEVGASVGAEIHTVALVAQALNVNGQRNNECGPKLPIFPVRATERFYRCHWLPRAAPGAHARAAGAGRWVRALGAAPRLRPRAPAALPTRRSTGPGLTCRPCPA